ncbi:MAG: DUF262 domain-containing protein [Bacteroidetes bacterium]|nr:DUF262 domain-containing protein [Bacteroidota bacterium]
MSMPKENAGSLAEMEQETFDDEGSYQIPPDDIVAYNELRSCADIFRLYTQGVLDIQPDFQRDIAWQPAAQTKFIDSLVKQLPIPSLCFAYDFKKQKWIVIDGLQRINTIVKFLNGEDWRLSNLNEVDPNLAGKNARELKDPGSAYHKLYNQVQNLTIPITVLRCDFSKRRHMDYIFTIFHRLNTGGVKLNNQEIRNCIYGGPFNKMLHEFDKHKTWRSLVKMKDGSRHRFVKQEIALRFLVFNDRFERYDGKLAEFLNAFMHEHRFADEGQIEAWTAILKRTVDFVYVKLMERKLPSRLPTTILESLLVGTARNLDALEAIPVAKARLKYRAFLDDDAFSEEALTEGLAKKEKVIGRLKRAIAIMK